MPCRIVPGRTHETMQLLPAGRARSPQVIEALRSEERHGAAQHRQRCLEQVAS